MHVVYMTRGHINDVGILNDFLKTKVFLTPYIDKNGKEILQPETGILQPIQLWSYVFPSQYKDHVFTALNFQNADRYIYNDPKIKGALWAARKAMGLKKIQEIKPIQQPLWMPKEAMKNIAVYPIGFKEDVIGKDADGNTTEML